MTGLPSVYTRGITGAPVVFLHGVGGDHSAWRPQLLHFGARFRCFAWDMPGYGASPALPDMSFPALAQALLDLLDALRLPKVHLVGQSLGGMIAQEFAVHHADRLSSLVLVATSPAFGKADKDWQQKFIDDRLGALDRGATMAELARDNVRRITGPDAEPLGVEIATACTANIPTESYKRAIHMLLSFDRRDELAKIAVPTLSIAGALDTVAPVAMMQNMAGRIPGASLVTVANAGHLINLERPDAFNAVLETFLAERNGGRL